ncbi:alpha/beta hydrolase [Aurantibacter crassamenti]|uniref:alpha/beta fold hydrolase n=1 Tax=Aurantibacter crassamenti TaxID=1837375 RepID=UPI001939F941|nr:alpha/beta hydrolase [Aurantibacter crassamenti]MBM1107601.1 alpha/beta hydrolase [Aurantibacter crassamenti]
MIEENEKQHIYCVPGLAASTSIFEYIKLPIEKFEIHLLKWFVPTPNMTLAAYAQELNKSIIHENVVLIGVSFGGILVQEMAKYKKVKKVIIISSVKTSDELPKKMRFASLISAHKLLPTSLVNNVEFMAKYAFGDAVTKRLHLYEKYLDVRDTTYLNWAIDQMVNWRQKEPPENIVHIHGDKDPVFPIERIKNCISVENGTHTMIIHRAKWFNEHLATIILQ